MTKLDLNAVLRTQVKRELERRKRSDPVTFFPWHRRQRWVLEKALDFPTRDPRIVLACGGNRGGKSALGKGLYSDTMRRKSRLATKLRTMDQLTGELRRKNDTDPITVWIIPPTLEKARQDWVSPTDGYSIRYWLGDLYVHEAKSPDHVFYSRPPGMSEEMAQAFKDGGDFSQFDKTIMKSHDQDILSFEASAVDLAIVDEEIMDEAKWNSLLLRIGTTNGTIVMCYTPLHGLSWSYERYWRMVTRLRSKHTTTIGTRQWVYEPEKGAVVVAVQFGAADNPQATEYADEIAADSGMSEAEKNARLYGEYGFVEGALVPKLSGMDLINPEKDHEVYVVDYLPGQKIRAEDRSKYSYDRVPGAIMEYRLVADPNKSYGATLAAVDEDGNLFFLAEHLEEAWSDRAHAEAFTRMIAKHCRPNIPISKKADPGSAGAQSIVNMAELGHGFQAVEKGAGSVGAGVKKLRSLSTLDPEHLHPITREKNAPRIYFYRPGLLSKWVTDTGHVAIGCRLVDQIGQARQTDNPNAPPDTPHKSIRSKLDLFDCARYTAVDLMPRPRDDLAAGERTPVNRLGKLPLPGMGPQVDPLDADIYVPDYFAW